MDDNAASFVGDIPRHYDEGLGPVLFRHYAQVMADRAAALDPSRVLETAAGTGIVSVELAARLGDAELVVTDLNGPMLEFARGRLPGVPVQEADMTALPFPEADFDAVVCQFGLMFLPDLAAGFREARRVLRPDGAFLFSVWDSHARNRFAAIVDGLLGELFGAEKPPFYAVPFRLGPVDPLRELAQAEGFGHLTVEVIPHRSPVEDWSGFVRGLIQGNPVLDQIRARGTEPTEVEATVRERLVAEFGESPTELPIQTLLYDARLA